MPNTLLKCGSQACNYSTLGSWDRGITGACWVPPGSVRDPVSGNKADRGGQSTHSSVLQAYARPPPPISLSVCLSLRDSFPFLRTVGCWPVQMSVPFASNPVYSCRTLRVESTGKTCREGVCGGFSIVLWNSSPKTHFGGHLSLIDPGNATCFCCIRYNDNTSVSNSSS